MKQLFYLIFAFFLLTVQTAIAKDQTGFYMSMGVSGAIQQYANPGLSVSGGDTHSFSEEDDTSFGGSLALGYDFSKMFNMNIRTELEYTMRSETDARWMGSQGIFIAFPVNWVFNGDTSVDTLMLNTYYDFKNNTRFTPYISAGLGVSFTDTTVGYMDDIGTSPISISDDDSEFVWTLGLGCGYAINDNWTMSLGYRYLDAGETELSYQGILKVGMESVFHEAVMTLRYTF